MLTCYAKEAGVWRRPDLGEVDLMDRDGDVIMCKKGLFIMPVTLPDVIISGWHI